MELSPLATTILCALAIFILILNLGLLGFFLRRKNTDQDKAVRLQQKIRKGVSNPWASEDSQWQELSRQVRQYRGAAESGEDQDQEPRT